jgi:hypothetical protein
LGYQAPLFLGCHLFLLHSSSAGFF